jgi:para-nitrobenzyl esterase
VTVNTEVELATGRIAGIPSGDDRVVAFRGVPYGAPPVGQLRWRPTQPAKPWTGVRSAAFNGPSCPQPPLATNSLMFAGHEYRDEDCLNLNLWTAAEPGERRPVMVFIHQGGHQFGSASVPFWDGDGLARAGVVAIAVNHRLNRFGFLAHPELTAESEHAASGNYGYYDLLAALAWVQEHAEVFGGDPDRVTLFGQSAGAQATSALMCSPLAHGLFHRAIAQSGAFLGARGPSMGQCDTLSDLDQAEHHGLAVADALGVSSLAGLRAVPAHEVLAAPLPLDEPDWLYDAAPGSFRRGAFDAAWPIVDGHLLPQHPYEVFAAGRQMDVPLITGSNSGERAGCPYLPTRAAYEADVRAEVGDLADEYLSLYPAATDEQAVVASGEAFADRIFAWQNWTMARLHARHASSPTFYYHWCRVPPVPAEAGYAERDPGAFHGAEFPYVFRNLAVRDWPWTDHDRRLSETIAGYWVTHAASGDPNGDGRPHWPGFDPHAPESMTFGQDAIGMGPVPRRAQADFFDGFFDGRRPSRSAPSGAPAAIS